MFVLGYLFRPGLESGGLSALMLLYFTEGTVGAYCLSFVFILTVESEREQGFNIVMHHKVSSTVLPTWTVLLCLLCFRSILKHGSPGL